MAVVKAVGLENTTADYSILDKFSNKSLISKGIRKCAVIGVENGVMN